MTGRTHDLAAFTTMAFAASIFPIAPISLATAVTALGANIIGGIVPDIDQPTNEVWHKIPAGSLFGHVIDPLLGNHRMLSHSLFGLVLAGFLIHGFLVLLGTVLLVNMNLVWWATMLGYFSHLVADSLTKEGVPWFFPVPVRIGFPPLKFLRITTGGAAEKFLVFPGLVVANGYLIWQNYSRFIFIFTHLAR